MITIDRDLLDEITEHAGIDDSAVRTDYSGRAMYGASCIGITGDIADFALFMVAVAEFVSTYGDDKFTWGANDWAERVRTDSMGRETIFYFPGIAVDAAA